MASLAIGGWLALGMAGEEMAGLASVQKIGLGIFPKNSRRLDDGQDDNDSGDDDDDLGDDDSGDDGNRGITFPLLGLK